MKKIVILLVTCLFSAPAVLYAQSSLSKEDERLATNILTNIYNFKFSESKRLIKSLDSKHPKHPVTPFLKAYNLSWENFPIDKANPHFAQYNIYLNQVLTYADARLDKNKNDREGNFFKMMAFGLLALYEAESGNFVKSASYGKKSFSYIKKGFDLTDEYPAYHLTTGLYKYYAKQYPQTHPAVKPFMVFFPGGDKVVGLKHINLAVQHSPFSKVEALMYLVDIYGKYEEDYYNAWLSGKKLIDLYPNNPFFWVKYCETLISLGRFAEAELYLPKFKSRSENIYHLATDLFRGIINEKYYKKQEAAKASYLNVTRVTNYDPRYGKDYQAFAYAGLARIALKQGDEKTAKKHYRQALKLAEYEGIRKEAKAYIKS